MDYEISFGPQNKTVKVRPGTTVLQAARQARIFIATRCGGNAGCLMCKVSIGETSSSFSSPERAELHKLGELIDQGTRLACQAKIVGNGHVDLPEDPLKAAVRRQLEMQQNDDLW
ncbi:2Fe-2S ferredoxin [Paenibacillus shirakamiensis]|uniref:2Fe-2S ferredoxin n=1 Tax=Paenibacillus shirakamiensis TaxID=1265935 RepID=A0ABS4JCV2_9BACL|nr:2Fe-2S iron-sulfur cluster-binding protein [Paenibacillus shirakamiensis]MBP1999528.1 2Fe-2S ferredoxin [Paenibacillus shirakamiensis]